MKWIANYVGAGGMSQNAISAKDEPSAKQRAMKNAPHWWERMTLKDAEGVIATRERKKRWKDAKPTKEESDRMLRSFAAGMLAK